MDGPIGPTVVGIYAESLARFEVVEIDPFP